MPSTLATKDYFPSLSLSEPRTTISHGGGSTLTKYEPPTAPYVEAYHQGGKQKPTAIILRPSFTNSEEGAALAVAQYWNKSSSFWDAGHYTVDSTKRFRCVRDNVIAGIDNSGKGELRVALCADPISGKQFWDEDEHRLVLRNAAQLVAELSLAHKIKVRYLDEDRLERWGKFRTRARGGIHIYETSGFPFQAFIDEVNAQRVLKTHI